jgi:signal transduction histidine kinase/CheY-like chemotaxis protein/HPt (histidine-containing phosphotransfer) domain-containing protein
MSILGFDVLTLVFGLSMHIYAMGLAFFVLAKLNIGGRLNRDIGIGIGLFAVASSMLLVRAPHLQHLTLPGGTAIGSIGVYVALRAIREYIGAPFARSTDIAVGVISIAYFLYIAVVDNSDFLRVFYVALFFSISGFAAAWPILAGKVELRPVVARMVLWTVGWYPIGYGFMAVVCVISLIAPDILPLSNNDLIVLAFIITGTFTVLVMLGYLAIVIENLFHQFRGYRQRAESIVHFSPIAAILTDSKTHHVVDLNQAFSRMFDIEREPIIGTVMPETGLINPRWLSAYRARLLETGSVEGMKVARRDKRRGTKKTFKIWGYLIHLNSAPHFLTFVSNISDEVRAAQVIRRERELAQNEVQVKSRFLAMMSHDFRTPLSAASGLADLLRATERDPKKQQRLDSIISAMSTLSRMVDDILDMSRLNSGTIRIAESPFDPVVLAERVEAVCGPSAAFKRLDLSVEVDPDLPHFILGDQHRLGQIALNLISNAVKFTEQGRVVFSIGQGLDLDGTPNFFMEVRDTGIGINPVEVETLFEPFRQGERAREAGGVGLGLSICREIAHAMRGVVNASRRPGGGSIFRFQMPLQIAEPPTSASEDKNGVSNFWSGIRVLLAEDTNLNREVMAEQLRLAGASVVSVSDGAPVPVLALGAFPRFDIVLLDVHMIGVSGIETAVLLRSNLRGEPLLIAALTAFSADSEKEKCLEAGIDLFFSKPPDLEKMAHAIAAHREVERADAGAPESFGFDMVKAAKGWGDDATPVATLLGRFVAAYSNFDGQLTGLFDAQDGNELFTTVHQLHGLAGLLHAESLKDAAAKAEKTLYDATKSTAETRTVLVALERVVSQHVRLLEDIASPPPPEVESR